MEHAAEVGERRREQEGRGNAEDVARRLVGGRYHPGDRRQEYADDDDQRAAFDEQRSGRRARGSQLVRPLVGAADQRDERKENIAMQTIITLAIAAAKPMLKNSRPCFTA